ncbi:unnamed protein product, partial [Ceratitis capitata]
DRHNDVFIRAAGEQADDYTTYNTTSVLTEPFRYILGCKNVNCWAAGRPGGRTTQISNFDIQIDKLATSASACASAATFTGLCSQSQWHQQVHMSIHIHQSLFLCKWGKYMQ